MQPASKTRSRSGSSDVPHKTSPVTPRATQQKRVSGLDSGSVPSFRVASRTPTDRSPKIDRKSPRSSPASEKKRISRIADLELQLTQVQEDLKKTKELLSSCELSKKRATQEAEEAKKQSAALTAKLEDTKHQLLELSASEDARIQELRKLSQERDRAWQSELEAVHKQNSVDSAALASAMNEIQKLKLQVEMVMDSEATQAKLADLARSELESLKLDMTETVSLMEALKADHESCERLEAEYQGLVNETQMQLQVANSTIEALRSDGTKETDSLSCVRAELEASRAEIELLEETIRKLPCHDPAERCLVTPSGPGCKDGELGAGVRPARYEVEQLKSSLEVAEIGLLEELVKSTVRVYSAYELAESVKARCSPKEMEEESARLETNAGMTQLRTSLSDKEAELGRITVANEKLKEDLEKLKATLPTPEFETKMTLAASEITELRASLRDREARMQEITGENELLKLELQKKEAETGIHVESAARRRKDKIDSGTAKAAEQLEAAPTNLEVEAELKRLRIQSEQWRKAAEAAAAILGNGNHGKLMERTGSMDSTYVQLGGKFMNSPYSDEESPKKRNSNVLRKLGVLWKKGSQK